ILRVWDFDIRTVKAALARSSKRKIGLLIFPPLCRWSSYAAWKFFKRDEPGLDLRTYRQTVRRLGLRQDFPILVQNIKLCSGDVDYTAAGMRWLRETGVLSNQLYETAAQYSKKVPFDALCKELWRKRRALLGAATQNGKKMSHDVK